MSLLLPKAPISAFFFFSQERRAKVKANNPEMSFAEVAKHLGKMWKEMPEEDKAPYHKTAAQDKDRYARDVQAYWEIHGERPPTPAQVKRAKEEDASDAVSKKKRRSAAKDPNRVKRPTTAFFFFSSAKRQEVKEAGPELKTTEVAVKLGQMWKDLSEEERRPYMDLADADRKRYEDQMLQPSSSSAAASVSGSSPPAFPPALVAMISTPPSSAGSSAAANAIGASGDSAKLV